MDRFKIISKKDIGKLPKTSGVYAFAEIHRGRTPVNLLYIGKAVNIRSRVKNHFNQPSYRDDLFISKIDKIGFFETNSEIEALVLEAALIKKYRPKYNVVWRDDKNYFYVAVEQNKQKIPHIYITHQPRANSKFEIRNSKFTSVGPFVEGTALKKTLRFLRRVFPHYTSASHPQKKCVWCHLGLCPGPLLFENPPSPKASAGLREYRRNLKKLILILQGKRQTALNLLKREMKLASEQQDYEKAGKIRDQIFALQQIMSHVHVLTNGDNQTIGNKSAYAQSLPILLNSRFPISKIECYDVSNIQGKFATGSMVVFVDGKPDKNQYRKFKIRLSEEPNDIAMLKEVLTRRFSHPEWPYPDAILIDGGKAQFNAAIEIRNKSSHQNVRPHNSMQSIQIMSIAKGRQELFIEDKPNPTPLKNLPQDVYNLVKNLDDEAHRFAITYHKKLRRKNLLK